MTHDELIAALEAGPSRGLDAEIVAVLSAGATVTQYLALDLSKRDPKHYTTSLDAAATLVPKGWVRRNSQIRFDMWLIELWQGDKSFREKPDAEGIHELEATALCIAALKAHTR